MNLPTPKPDPEQVILAIVNLVAIRHQVDEDEYPELLACIAHEVAPWANQVDAM